MDNLLLTAPDGTRFRDLDHDGIMAPFENPNLTPEERAEDLVGRLSLEEKVGLAYQAMIEPGPDGELLPDGEGMSGTPTRESVLERKINHFNVLVTPSPRLTARWVNRLQELAAQTPHSIPVTLSTDPRHSGAQNVGAAITAGAMSTWPEPLGMAAIQDAELVRTFANIARQEYLAVGIRAALHPQIDLGTEPRWGRQFHTFGNNAEFVADVAAAYIQGFQVDADLGPESVATMAKHFPGGGPQLDGEDPHFPYGQEQVYPGKMFDYHLVPFERAIEVGTSAIMPYYGVPIDLELDGQPVEEVAFGFNKQILTGLLRDKLGFEGVICTDWGLITDAEILGKMLPARAWGMEDATPLERTIKAIEAGADQFGGETTTHLLLEAVRNGAVEESRLDQSVYRLLLVKFQLGLFDNPFVDEDAAESIVGHADFVKAGLEAQAKSMVLLKNDGILPLAANQKVYVEGFDEDAAKKLGTVVATPEEADVAVIRLPAPFDPRDDLALEAFFQQGTLEYRPGLIARLQHLAKSVPVVIDANLERPAILTPLVSTCAAILGDVGVSDQVVAEVVIGDRRPEGRLPFEMPRSTEAVLAADSDVPNDTEDPLFEAGYGLSYQD